MNANIGTLAAEAGELLDAVAVRLSAARASGDPSSGTAESRSCPTCGHDATESCTSCPICRLLAVLRGERPEVTARWIDSALTIVAALRALVPAPDSSPGTAAADPGHPADRPSEPTGGTGAGLQHIDIR